MDRCPKLRAAARIVVTFSLALAVALSVVPATAAIDGSDTGAVALLVKSRVPLTPEVVEAIVGHSARVTYVWPEIDSMAVSVVPAKIVDLVTSPLVELIEADLQAGATNDDPSLADGNAATTRVVVPLFTSASPIQTWNQDLADTAGSGFTGAGVTVAVVDSGLPQNWREFLPENSVDLEHAAGFGAEGWGDFHNPVNAIRGAGGHIGLFPHGLAVSSVIVGFPSDFGFIGGAAPGAKILPVRVLNQFNFGWTSWFTAGILHVANLKASGALPGPVVINFSIQSRSASVILAGAINYALNQGVLFVTIAGNFGPAEGTLAFPGRMPQAITAGASGWKGAGSPPVDGVPWFFGDVPEGDASQIYIPSFSGREAAFDPPGSLLDVVAPGTGVYGEWLSGPGFSEGREVAFDAVDNSILGTSFAAPHVAGIVAQMLEKNPGLGQIAAEGYLKSTALPIPASAGGCTFLDCYAPWDGRASGAGQARGAAAVAAVPAP